jgi:hypothetical protein
VFEEASAYRKKSKFFVFREFFFACQVKNIFDTEFARETLHAVAPMLARFV